jgi:SagB-type dehydrogenase family enzyme
VLHNYAAGRSVRADPFLIEVLEAFGDWRPAADYLAAEPPAAHTTAVQLLAVLHRDGWLQHRDDRAAGRDGAFDAWAGWNPSAGFFHTASRQARFRPLDEVIETLARRAKSHPMPAPAKRYPDASATPLPAPAKGGAFAATLRDRRTWRRFGTSPVKLKAFSTLIHLTAGVQRWVTARGEGQVALKTSPSGGARHPIELYVVARRIDGLAPGIYHYAADRHLLEHLPGVPPAFDEVLPTQWWYRDAAALVLFTALFERTRWRYSSPRAYRAVMIEAGHVCQTFCLTATSLGLAPFCSMAIADTKIERLLGIDGINEAVVYAAGVGTRPSAKGMAGALPRRRKE